MSFSRLGIPKRGGRAGCASFWISLESWTVVITVEYMLYYRRNGVVLLQYIIQNCCKIRSSQWPFGLVTGPRVRQQSVQAFHSACRWLRDCCVGWTDADADSDFEAVWRSVLTYTARAARQRPVAHRVLNFQAACLPCPARRPSHRPAIYSGMEADYWRPAVPWPLQLLAAAGWDEHTHGRSSGLWLTCADYGLDGLWSTATPSYATIYLPTFGKLFQSAFYDP